MSDLARVVANGKELAIYTTTLSAVRPSGSELAVVAVSGHEGAKGGQDLAK